MSKSDPTGLEDITVHGNPPEAGNPAAAITTGAPPAFRGLQGLIARAMNGSKSAQNLIRSGAYSQADLMNSAGQMDAAINSSSLASGGVASAIQVSYFHNDYQNTMGIITSDGYSYSSTSPYGTVEYELSDVFGQPRLTNGSVDPTWGANDVSKRRYINQEDLTDAHLIDLNARVYDPLIGKFLSPDPIISDQDDSQSWNAYAYSHNNPMSESDPTGLAGGCSTDSSGNISCSSSVSASPPPAAPPQAAPQASPPTSFRMPQSQGIHYDPEVGSDASATARSAGDYAAHAPSNPRSVLSSVGQRAYSSARSAAVGAYGAAASIASRAGSIAESIAVTLEEDSDVRAALDLLGAEVPAEGILAAEGLSAAEQLAANRAAGAAFEQAVGANLEQSGLTVGQQITIETESGVRTRLDFLTQDPLTGEIGCIECKASPTAPLTPNQTLAFPEIGQSGGTIVGAGKPGFPGGLQLPPTAVQILRGP